MLDQESSQRIDVLRFPLIVGVVFIHAYETSVGLSSGVIGVSQNHFITEFVRNIISKGLAQIAVPLFFLMAGYLFFVGFDASREAYVRKFKNRTRTLLIPFLFWNLATLLLTAFAQAMPATQPFFSGSFAPIASYGFFDYLIAIFGVGRYPISHQFWFIRDLMLLILLTPVLHWANKYVPLPFLVILFVCWIRGIWPVYSPSGEAALFFAAGSFLGGSKKSLFAFDKYGMAAVVLYFPIVVADVLFIQESFTPYLHRVGIVIGAVAVLFSTKWIVASTRLKRSLLSLGTVSFFVYASHEPLLVIARKVVYKMLSPESWGLVLALYFSIPILVIVLLVASYRVLSDISPRFLSLVSGGRNIA